MIIIVKFLGVLDSLVSNIPTNEQCHQCSSDLVHAAFGSLIINCLEKVVNMNGVIVYMK